MSPRGPSARALPVVLSLVALSFLQTKPSCAGEGPRLALRLAKLGEQGRTCVLVTHELHQASRLAQQALVLVDGRVAHRAEGAELERDALEEAYARATEAAA